MTGLSQTLEVDSYTVAVQPVETEEQIRACAQIMSTSEPWITLGRTMAQAERILRDREVQEVHVALHDGEVVGFVILILKGAFVGYLRTIAVRADWRSRGLGRRLIRFAEERIFRESPNAFLCVSSFNPRARSLYERLGYETVGELRDYIVRGHSEWLMRKTLGPHAEFRREIE